MRELTKLTNPLGDFLQFQVLFAEAMGNPDFALLSGLTGPFLLPAVVAEGRAARGQGVANLGAASTLSSEKSQISWGGLCWLGDLGNPIQSKVQLCLPTTVLAAPPG